MAHMLEQDATGKASMCYVGETPWHKLGQEVTDEAVMYDPELFIKAAGLDWEAEKVQLRLAEEHTVDGKTVQGDLVNAFAVRRTTDKKILADSVGARYNVLQNRDAFKWFSPWLEAKTAALHTAGALFEGSRVWILAKLNADPMEIAAGDIVEKYILLSHSHDGTLAIRVGFTPIRVVCWNTLSMSHSDNASKLIRLKHSKNMHVNLENLRDTMNLVNQEFEATAEQYRLLASKSINQSDLRKYIKHVFEIEAEDNQIWTGGERSKELKAVVSERQKNILDDVVKLMESGKGNNLPSVSGTYWSAYNGVTEYLSYVNGRNADNRLSSLWYGEGSKMNSRALEAAVAMASGMAV